MKKQNSQKAPEEAVNQPEAAASATTVPPDAAAPEPAPAPLVRNRYADQMNAKKKLPKPAKFAIGAVVLALLGGGGYFAVTKLNEQPETVSEEKAV